MALPFTPVVFYRDPKAALAWLEAAFGFETSLLVTDPDGKVGHAEMSFGEGRVGIGGEWASPELLGPASMKSPASMDGVGSQFITVDLADDVDAHCARAEAAGARVTQRPEDKFYGARVYYALDLEGHTWCFSERTADLSAAEMAKASGLAISTSL